MPRRGSPIKPTRSKKSGRPPEPSPIAPRVRRRQKPATAAVRKDTMLLQPAQDTRARWPAAKPQFKKR